MFHKLVLATFFWLVLGSGSSVWGQRIPGYAARPPVSPYLNLFRNNNSGLNNYHTFVRPQLDQLQFNQMQMSQTMRLQQQLRGGSTAAYNGAPAQQNLAVQLQNAIQLLGPQHQGVGQPKLAANYFNYMHYYGVPVSNAAPAGGVTRRR